MAAAASERVDGGALHVSATTASGTSTIEAMMIEPAAGTSGDTLL